MTLTFTLAGALLFALLASGKVITEEELDQEELETILRELTHIKSEKSNNEESRIIGGSNSNEGDHPWLVSLRCEIPYTMFGIDTPVTKATLRCGGSLIKRRWVLTAAHCVDNPKHKKASTAKYWTARLGEVERESSFGENIKDFFGDIIGHDDWRTWEIKGERIIVHKGYNAKESWLHDIALLKLEEAVPLEEELVGQVTLPAQGDPHPTQGERCLAMGWGCKRSGGGSADISQKVELTALSKESCRSVWQVSLATRLCAGKRRAGKGICPGDSGGPLMCRRNNKWYQAGVASFAERSQPQNFPGVFTRVSSYANWIEANTKG